MGRLELSFQILARALAAEEEESFDALEIAVDVFHRCNCFDAMYCRHVALGRYASAFLAVHLLDVVVAIIEGGGEMRCSATGLTASDWPIIDQHHGASRARE